MDLQIIWYAKGWYQKLPEDTMEALKTVNSHYSWLKPEDIPNRTILAHVNNLFHTFASDNDKRDLLDKVLYRDAFFSGNTTETGHVSEFIRHMLTALMLIETTDLPSDMPDPLFEYMTDESIEKFNDMDNRKETHGKR